ncbi:hypothetical protein EZL74_09345 [Flavobacterium silvisoli]|uniref:DUF4468 domain-containing protein n=1 Tax=Flavobacterium silvisoli TaxID=2529433 RepID=A0A4Q9YVD6_9FLAO|nr:hypothetical protein [Flavobacterium silvisoli]TBX67678.1 hypothetical protein EZL74_09345 [Flavobacterium silvisoli]
MKLKALLLLAFVSLTTFAQDTEFKFAKEGLTDFIVGKYEGSAKELYGRTMGWIKENKGYSVVSSVENEKITFKGKKDPFICSKAGGTNVCTIATFVIEITFKEGKYKFDPISLEEFDRKETTTPQNLNDFSNYYNKDGSLKKYKDNVPAAYEDLFNGVNKNLLDYMDKKKKAEEW